MSILVTCGQCSAKDRVAAEFAGKAILCKTCHAPMVVPSSGDAGEAGTKTTAAGGTRRTRNWGDEEERKAASAAPKSSRRPSMVIVGIVLALSCVLCMGVGSIAAWWAMSDMQVQPRPGKNVDHFVIVNDERPMKPGVDGDNGRIPPGVGPIVLQRQGRLMLADANRDGKPHQPFTMHFEQGKTYVIDMRSVEMDSYLWIYDPNGTRVAFDDDSGGNQNARIRYTATQTGEHVIGATMFSTLRAEGAAFTVTVREE